MVVILVAITLTLLVFADWLLRRNNEPGGEVVAAQLPESKPIKLVEPLCAGGFHVQPEMSYHLGHAWALEDGPSRARVGIDEFAAKLVGEADHIDLPQPGDRIVQGGPAWVLHHGDRHATMLSPVTGEVVAVNPLVNEHKVSLSNEPYTQGWLLSVRVQDFRRDQTNLLHGDLPLKWMELSSAQLRSKLKNGVELSFRDGGNGAGSVCDMVDEAQWNDVVHEFLLADARH